MDFELLPLLVGVALGGLLSRGGKGVVKPLVKGYMNLADKAREMSATVREDLRDAVEEARYEYRQEASAHDEAGMAVAAPAAQEEAPAKPSRSSSSSSRRRSGASTESGGSTRSRSTSTRRSGSSSRPSRSRSAAPETETKGEDEQAKAA